MADSATDSSSVRKRGRPTECLIARDGTDTSLELTTAAPDEKHPAKAPAVVQPLCSVIMTMRNAEQWLDESIGSVADQLYRPLELCAYDDRSTDASFAKVEAWRAALDAASVRLVLNRFESEDKDPSHAGVGYGKNRAISSSSGEFLCFLDSDDVMMPERIKEQMTLAQANINAIVGCNFFRLPENSTQRYTDWCNRLTDQQLMTQRFKECTVIMPTWLTHRSNIEKCGGFDCLLAEDLRLFYRHIARGGSLLKVHKPLLMYRYHPAQASHGQSRDLLFQIRASAFHDQILNPNSPFYSPRWESFSIWGAGRDGKRFFKLLSDENKKKVRNFCDVDPDKIGKVYADFMLPEDKRVYVPIQHWSNITAPFVTCVALDRDSSQFEANLRSLSVVEGVDFFLFG